MTKYDYSWSCACRDRIISSCLYRAPDLRLRASQVAHVRWCGLGNVHGLSRPVGSAYRPEEGSKCVIYRCPSPEAVLSTAPGPETLLSTIIVTIPRAGLSSMEAVADATLVVEGRLGPRLR